MSKYFTDIQVMKRPPFLGKPNEFHFSLKNVPVSIGVANAIRRSLMDDVHKFTISPETVSVESNNSPWTIEMIKLQLMYSIFDNDYLEKKDINMLELVLDAKNEEKSYRYVFAKELSLFNKETKENIKSDKFVVYPQVPLFPIGSGDEVKLKCSLEYMSKRECSEKSEEYTRVARHQTATVGYFFENKEESDPQDILFSVVNLSSYDSKKLIDVSIGNIIRRLEEMKDNINKEKNMYIQLNKEMRYNLVFTGEDHTLGNLISRWVNRYDTKAFCAYKQNPYKRYITIDFGLVKFSPEIMEDFESKNLEEAIEKSIASLDVNKENKQKKGTIEAFIIHIDNIIKFMKELHSDFNKTNVNEIPLKEYKEWLENFREKLTQ